MSQRTRVRKLEGQTGKVAPVVILRQILDPEGDEAASGTSYWIQDGARHEVHLQREPDEPLEDFRWRLNTAAALEAQARAVEPIFILNWNKENLL